MGFSKDSWLLLTCAALGEIGSSLWHPTAIALLARRLPGRRGLEVWSRGMGGNLGDALAPLVAGMLLTYLTWREVVIVNIIPGIAMSAVLLYCLGRMQSKPRPDEIGGEPARRSLSHVLRNFGTLLSNRTLVFICASSIFRSMTYGGLMTFLPIYLASELHYAPKWIGASMAALQIAGFIATPISGHLSDKVGRRQIIMSSMGMTAVIIVFMIFAGGSEAFVYFIAFLVFFLFSIRAVMQAWLLDATPPNMGGSSIGLLFAIQALGSSMGPLSCGIIADHYGLHAAFYFLVGTIIVANMLIFFTPIPDKPLGGKARFAGQPAE